MIIITNKEKKEKHNDLINQMYQLRYRIFCEKLEWEIESNQNLEKDEYDNDNTTYILHVNEQQKVIGALRFITMNNPCMFKGPFDSILCVEKCFNKKHIEISRMVIDDAETITIEDKKRTTLMLLVAFTEYVLNDPVVEHGLFVAFPSVIRLYNCYGMNIEVIDTITRYGDELCIGQYTATEQSLNNLKEKLNNA
jgi:acyl homoserine lactone synthase